MSKITSYDWWVEVFLVGLLLVAMVGFSMYHIGHLKGRTPNMTQPYYGHEVVQNLCKEFGGVKTVNDYQFTVDRYYNSERVQVTCQDSSILSRSWIHLHNK